MKSRIKSFLILIVIILFLIIQYFVQMPCLFRQAFGIYCPACGLTSSFFSILSFNFIDSIYYNILSIPIFVGIIAIIILLIKDIIKNNDNGKNLIFKFFKRYYILIIVFVLFSFFFNNLK